MTNPNDFLTVTEDRRKLVLLRITLARVAQSLAVNGSGNHYCIPVTQGMNYDDLHRLASNCEEGWNMLGSLCIDRSNELQGI